MDMDKKEIEKYFSMEERAKRFKIENAPDTEENRKKRAEMRAKEFANYGELQKQFEKEHFKGRGSGGGGMSPTDIEKTKRPGALKMKKGGVVSASKRADGIVIRGKTKGRMVRHG